MAPPPPSLLTSTTMKRARDTASSSSNNSDDTSAQSIKKPRWGAPPLNSSSRIARPTVLARASSFTSSTSSTSSSSITNNNVINRVRTRTPTVTTDDLARLQYDALRSSNEQMLRENAQLQQQLAQLETTARSLEQQLADTKQRVAARARAHEPPSSLTPAAAFIYYHMHRSTPPAAASHTNDNDVVHAVVYDLVTAVEAIDCDARTIDRALELDGLQFALAQQQRDVDTALQRLVRDTSERDAFDALDRRVLDDRVAELDVQLAQTRAREREKDAALERLRCFSGQEATHDKDEEQALYAAQTHVVALEATVSKLQQQVETHAFERVEVQLYEAHVASLQAHVEAFRGQTAALAARHQEVVTALDAAQLQQRVADAEALVKRNEVARLLQDKAALKQQVQTAKQEIEHVRRAASATQAHKQALEAVVAQLKAQLVDAVTAQTDTKEAAAVVVVDDEENSDNRIAQLESEKRALEAFVGCYYDAAETRCRALMHEVAQYETPTITTTMQQQQPQQQRKPVVLPPHPHNDDDQQASSDTN